MKKRPTDKSQSSANERGNFNSTEAQRARLLAALRRGPVTTIEARRDLDILMPAARVFELRHREGYDIALHWVHEATQAGRLHRVARYALMSAHGSSMA
ncbi:helix-turn-helix domain-containing protein [Ralstonia pseudosolanacearum]|uniref:helix-turn-helix domain-containing protein n=1 Tax=Ralstonia pseudosolanacearum TaxID=1310165 RepID=UPI0018D1BF82|nr:helix-turn-helix domain-containing protein [Ralstonia pseudosolanacearum]